MLFLKENLHFHYNWSAEGTASTFTGSPSRRLFDRFNGNQVLFIINSFMSSSEKFTVDDARKVEELITTQLPMEAKSEISVLNWLQEVFNAPLKVS
jgi:hypothetical protein